MGLEYAPLPEFMHELGGDIFGRTLLVRGHCWTRSLCGRDSDLHMPRHSAGRVALAMSHRALNVSADLNSASMLGSENRRDLRMRHRTLASTRSEHVR